MCFIRQMRETEISGGRNSVKKGKVDKCFQGEV